MATGCKPTSVRFVGLLKNSTVWGRGENCFHVPTFLACVLKFLEGSLTDSLSLMSQVSIMAYGSTPYVGMTPKKMAATFKVHK